MTGNNIIDNCFAGLSLLVALGVLGLFIYTQFIHQRPVPSNQKLIKEEFLPSSKQQLFVETYKINKLIINLPSQRGRLRFLDLEMHLRPFSAQQINALEEKMAFIYDSIIDTAGHMKPDELDTLYGKTLLEGRLKKRINALFPQPTLREVFFTRFVVQ